MMHVPIIIINYYNVSFCRGPRVLISEMTVASAGGGKVVIFAVEAAVGIGNPSVRLTVGVRRKRSPRALFGGSAAMARGPR